MISRWLAPLLLLLGIGAMSLVIWIKLRPIPEDTAFAGSATCRSCHRPLHQQWSESQHTRMMRSLANPAVVVADFDDPDLGFDRADAVWAIGGKWEQQFMGRDGGRETLLPGAWLNFSGRWDFNGWDGWQEPDPIRRCHGCHTVGLDVETGRFVEPNIGCESCHGPSAWHVKSFGLGAVYVGVEAEVCGQCHTRGTSPSGEYLFPVDYRPGSDLDEHFQHSKPTLGQNSTFWFGNGRERKRHQEYIAWRSGGHAKSLESLGEGYDGRYGVVSRECMRCHSAEYALPRGEPPPPDEVSTGITCSVCHNVHGSLDEPRMTCDACHVQGAYYHRPNLNSAHVPCPPDAEAGCVSCHMPLTVKIGGAYAFHDHSPGVIPPSDAVAWGTPSSCSQSGCHASEDAATLQQMFELHYAEDPKSMGSERVKSASN